jgi:hypothetical protein
MRVCAHVCMSECVYIGRPIVSCIQCTYACVHKYIHTYTHEQGDGECIEDMYVGTREILPPSSVSLTAFSNKFP